MLFNAFKFTLPDKTIYVDIKDSEEANAIPEANIERISIEISDIYSMDLEIIE